MLNVTSEECLTFTWLSLRVCYYATLSTQWLLVLWSSVFMVIYSVISCLLIWNCKFLPLTLKIQKGIRREAYPPRACNGSRDIRHIPSPGWCGSVGCMPDWELKSHWFDSQSGHMPGLWAGPYLGRASGNWSMFSLTLMFPSVFLPSPFSKKIIKSFFFFKDIYLDNCNTELRGWSYHLELVEKREMTF